MIEQREPDWLLDHSLTRLYGTKTGLIRWQSCAATDRHSPHVQLTVPSTANVGIPLGTDSEVSIEASGKAIDIESALAGGAGEFVERYCLSWVNEDDFVRTTFESLNESQNVVDPKYFDIYDPPLEGEWMATWDRTTECAWTRGTNLLTGEHVYLPAQLVWMRRGPLASEPVHFPGTSNGCAAGPSLEFALREALYEVIERDAFMRTWCTERTPRQISLENYPEIRELKERRIDSDIYSSHLFEFDSKIDIPVVGAAMRNHRDEIPKFVMGASAQPDRKAGLAEALVEISQGWVYIEQLAVQKNIDEIDPDAIVDNFEDNLLYYLDPEQFEKVRFLLEGPTYSPDTVDVSESTDELQYCVNELDRNGFTPIVFEVTTPDMLEAGLRVVRVFIPEMVPLTPPSVLPVHHPGFTEPVTNTSPHPFP